MNKRIKIGGIIFSLLFLLQGCDTNMDEESTMVDEKVYVDNRKQIIPIDTKGIDFFVFASLIIPEI